MAHSRIPDGWRKHYTHGVELLLPVACDLTRPASSAKPPSKEGVEVAPDPYDEVFSDDQEADAETFFVKGAANAGDGAFPVEEPDFSKLHASLDLPAVWAADIPEDERDLIRAVAANAAQWIEYVQVLSPDVREALRGDGGRLVPVGKGDDVAQAKHILKRLKDLERFPGLAGWRRVVLVDADLDTRLAGLGSDFPNFVQVLEYLRDRAALAARGDWIFASSPLLLVGPPGIGKTEFARRLAAVLGTRLLFIDMAAAQSSSTIAGSEEFWSNAKPGRLFDEIVDGHHASPLVLLDELDKASGDPRFDPIAPLYRLLEPASAQHFADAALPRITFDASRVLWLATANAVDHLPGPLLSRLALFHIEPPSCEQAREIAARVYAGLAGVLREAPVVDDEVLDVLARRHSVREFKRALESGLARAIRQASDRLLVTHLQPSAPVSRRIGF